MNIQQKPSFFDRFFGGDIYNNSKQSRRRQENGLFHMMWGKRRRDRIIVNPDLFWDSSEDSGEDEDEDEDDDDDDDDDDDVDNNNNNRNKKKYSTMTKSPSSFLSRKSKKTDVKKIIRQSKSHNNKSNNIHSLSTTTGKGAIIQQQYHDHEHEYVHRVYAATLDKLQNPPYNLRVSAALWCILSKSMSATTSIITSNGTTKSKKQRQQQQQQQSYEKLLPPLLTENPTGRRKVSCRYFLMLLETPVHQIRQNRHPIHEAVDRHRPRFQDVTTVTTVQHDPSPSFSNNNNNSNNTNINTGTSSLSKKITVVKKAKSFPTYWKRQREQRKPIIKCATATIAEEMKERRKKEMLHNNNKSNSNVTRCDLSLSSSLSSSSSTTTSTSTSTSSSTFFCGPTSVTTSFSSPVHRRSDRITTEEDDQDDVPLGLLKKTSVDNI